jgi:lysozyme
METPIPPNAIELVKKWEGLHKVLNDGLVYPYLCPAGVWTIGYGSTRHFDGSPITEDTPPLSPLVCEKLMLLELEKCVKYALAQSPMLVQYPESLGAIASFIFNLGSGRYRASTLRRVINHGDWPEAQIQIRKWVFAAGRRLPGLVARRNEEAGYLGA